MGYNLVIHGVYWGNKTHWSDPLIQHFQRDIQAVQANTETEVNGYEVRAPKTTCSKHPVHLQEGYSPGFYLSHEKRAPGWLGFIGDEILSSYMGIIINYYKDPY